MQAIRKDWNDSAGFLPIDASENNAFIGTFYGAGFALDSLYINSESHLSIYIGYVGVEYSSLDKMNISILGITNCEIRGKYNVGSLIVLNLFKKTVIKI